eukprot:7376862-Prymnesium_polylepis.1
MTYNFCTRAMTTARPLNPSSAKIVCSHLESTSPLSMCTLSRWRRCTALRAISHFWRSHNESSSSNATRFSFTLASCCRLTAGRLATPLPLCCSARCHEARDFVPGALEHNDERRLPSSTQVRDGTCLVPDHVARRVCERDVAAIDLIALAYIEHSLCLCRSRLVSHVSEATEASIDCTLVEQNARGADDHSACATVACATIKKDGSARSHRIGCLLDAPLCYVPAVASRSRVGRYIEGLALLLTPFDALLELGRPRLGNALEEQPH